MDAIVDILKAAGEPTRLRILLVLQHGELAAGELAIVLGQSQPRVSRHIKLLVEAGLIDRRPEGAWVFFKLAQNTPGARLTALILNEVGNAPLSSRDQDRLAQVHASRTAQAQSYFETAAPEWETLRKLHQPEEAVEAALLRMIGDQPVGLHLDLGAGTGRMLELFADRAASGEGVDSNRKMLAVARSRLDRFGDATLSLRQADVLTLPYDENHADLVTLHQVLHYLSDPALAVNEAARVLKPGGRLLIADFAPHQFEELREQHAHRRLGFSTDEISDYCTRSGLSVSAAETIEPEGQHAGLAVTIWLAVKPTAPHNTIGAG